MSLGLLLLLTVVVLLPVGMFLKNRGLFTRATPSPGYIAAARETGVSVCIPARNEEASIGGALDCLCDSTHPNLEVIVLDDHSVDRTRDIAESYGIKVIASAPLPEGWNGKQFACWQLANQATHARLLFIDADVRLKPEAIDLLLGHQMQAQVPLLSGFPRQITASFFERLLIPMMHYILLCYLPIDRMRGSTDPAFSAGCGQLFLALKSNYFECGGHRAIAASRHDGIQLPKAFRRHQFQTDIIDASDLATCRMYADAPSVLRGLLKNADEGIANPRLILVFTTLLFFGSIAPPLLLLISLCSGWSSWIVTYLLGLSAISFLPRLMAARIFHQSWLGAMLHPLSVSAFLAIQWTALIMKQMGIKLAWRGRI